MRQLTFVLFCAALLCAFGPPPPYDASALPDAAAARQHALNQCQARAATFKTLRASVDCGLAAHRLYAVTEKLRDMKSFQAYAARVRRAAADADSGKIAQADAAKAVSAARAGYEGGVEKSYAAWKAGQPQGGPLFNRAALPAASAARVKALTLCGAWTAPGSVASRTQCVLAADRAFTDAIGLSNMDLFYGYASVLRVDAMDAEDGRRTPAQMNARHDTLWREFLTTLDQGWAVWGKGR